MLKITPHFTKPPQAPSEVQPYENEPAVSYRRDEGSLSDFMRSGMERDVQRQYKVAIGKLQDFLKDKGSASNANAIASLEKFGKQVEEGSAGRFSRGLDSMYGIGKEALDALCVEIQNEVVPADVRAAVIEETARGLDVCSEGVVSNLLKAVETLRLGGDGLGGHAKAVWDELLDQSILEFVREQHSHEPHYAGNEIHYVNAYRNHLAADYGAATSTDKYTMNDRVRGSVIDLCRLYVKERVTPAKLVEFMAGTCLDQVHQRFGSYRHRPLSEEEVAKFVHDYEASLEAQFRAHYGKIPPYLLVNEFHGDATEDEPYTMVEHTSPLVRAIAINLHGAGVLVAPHFPEIGRTREEGYPIKQIDHGVYYVDIPEPTGETGFRALSTDDLDPGTASSAMIRAALNNTSEPERLKRFAPPAVWRMIRDTEPLLLPIDPAVRRYRAADEGHAQYIGDQFVAAAQTHVRRNDIFYALVYHGETELALRVLAFIDSADMVDKRSGNTPLHLAVKGGAAALVGALLDKGTKSNVRDKAGDTPLMLAARAGDVAAVGLLASRARMAGDRDDAVAMLNEKNDALEAPMHAAAKNGHPDVLKMLAAAGADINVKDRIGATPLIHAAKRGHTACVEALLEAGATVEDFANGSRSTPPRPGFNALMAAVDGGHVAVVEMLIRKGRVDVNQRDFDGKTALVRALVAKQMECALVLYMNGADVNRGQPLTGATPLIMVTQKSGDPEAIRFLLSAKADVNKAAFVGETPLMMAAVLDRAELVDILIDEGKADPDISDREGKTALMWAAFRGRSSSVTALLRRVDVNKTGKFGHTALMAAAEGGKVEIVRQLMNAGADINHQASFDGTTALIKAAFNRHDDVVQLLLDAGADPALTNRSGWNLETIRARNSRSVQGEGSHSSALMHMAYRLNMHR